MARKAIILIALAAGCLIIVQGCYTIIKHPKVNQADHSVEYYGNNCMDCHNEITEYPYGYGYSSFPGYWEDYHNYGLYYTFPWWWESYWWDINLEPNENYSPDAADRRRGILIPQNSWDYVPPPSEITNQTPPSGGDSGGGISTGDGSGDGGDSKIKEEKPSQNETEQKKPERRRLPSKEQ